MFDPVSFVVIVACETFRHVASCLMVWMIFAMAISKR